MAAFKSISCFVLFILAAGLASGQRPARVYAEGEVLVKLRTAAGSRAAAEANARIGARTIESFGELNWVRIKLPAGLTVEKALEAYGKLTEVESVQPNYYYRLLATPNDPQFANLYGMNRISAPAAWDLATGSSDTVVAIIDSGIKYGHEDLSANMWTNPGEISGNGIDDDGNGFVDDYYGYDFFFNDPDPMDENGHGTHVAGTVGAVGNNSIGVTGVNWTVRLMAVKIYDATGFGTTSAMLINAYNYVRMMKNRGVDIRVTNNSYGGCDEACGYDQATKDAIDALGDAGVLNVFAAGNNGRNIESDPFYPASYTSPGLLTAASSTSTDSRSGFSNFGPVSVDLAAPGSGILSTVMTAANYGTFSGTSMAAPHVAGAAALLSSYNPALSAASLKATLMNTVDQFSQWNGVVKTGGRLNVASALRNQTVCSFEVSASSIAVPTKGGHFTIGVSAPPNCDYAVKSSARWIKFSGPDALSGNGTISFRVTVNPTISRTGTISVAGQTVTVTQSRN